MESFQSILRKYVQQNSSVNPRQTAQGFLRIGGLGGAFNFGILSTEADRADRDDRNLSLLEAARNADRQDQLDRLNKDETLATIAARNAQTKASNAAIDDIPIDNARDERKLDILQQNADTSRLQANNAGKPTFAQEFQISELIRLRDKEAKTTESQQARARSILSQYREYNQGIDDLVSGRPFKETSLPNFVKPSDIDRFSSFTDLSSTEQKRASFQMLSDANARANGALESIFATNPELSFQFQQEFSDLVDPATGFLKRPRRFSDEFDEGIFFDGDALNTTSPSLATFDASP